MTMGRSLLLLGAAVLALARVHAAPLDADSCAQLKIEHSQLELGGVEMDMANGPEWAKANLAPEKLERIRRFIELKEQVLFRCRDKSLVNQPLENDSASAPNAGGKDKKKTAPNAARPPGAAKKTKAPPAARKKRKKTGRANKAAVRRAAKPAAGSAKPKPGAAKSKAAPRAAVKKPARTGVKPAPEAATENGAK